MDKQFIKNADIRRDYTISWDRRLGTGASGDVVVCTNIATQKQYALKCVSTHLRGLREAQLMWMCRECPYIIHLEAVYECMLTVRNEGSPVRRLCLVMELMEGGELFTRIEDKIAKQGYFSEAEAGALIKMMSSAVMHLHALGIAHRDLKPENFMFRDRSEGSALCLGDFGFAKEEGHLVTPVYTPLYAVPEIAKVLKDHALAPRTVQSYSKQCDVWSLGVILFIMLSGKPPFHIAPGAQAAPNPLYGKLGAEIASGAFDLDAPDWNGVSADAKNLVKEMMIVDPMVRITIDDALQHPWLKTSNQHTNPLPASAALQSKLGYRRDLHRPVLAATLTRLRETEDKLADLSTNGPNATSPTTDEICSPMVCFGAAPLAHLSIALAEVAADRSLRDEDGFRAVHTDEWATHVETKHTRTEGRESWCSGEYSVLPLPVLEHSLLEQAVRDEDLVVRHGPSFCDCY
eukprot:m.72663 g.72663  ORF g.72663 m.72663 type:complete len:461 (-) comp7692_c0_seq1:4143-5525(-)